MPYVPSRVRDYQATTSAPGQPRPGLAGLLRRATALAVIDVYERDGLIERSARMGAVMRQHHERLMERHPSVGTHRNIGLFGILELVRDRATFEPMAPFNGSSPEMKAVAQYLRDHGLFAATRWNTIAATPPLIISEDELALAYDIIDGALDLADKGVRAYPVRGR